MLPEEFVEYLVLQLIEVYGSQIQPDFLQQRKNPLAHSHELCEADDVITHAFYQLPIPCVHGDDLSVPTGFEQGSLMDAAQRALAAEDNRAGIEGLAVLNAPSGPLHIRVTNNGDLVTNRTIADVGLGVNGKEWRGRLAQELTENRIHFLGTNAEQRERATAYVFFLMAHLTQQGYIGVIVEELGNKITKQDLNTGLKCDVEFRENRISCFLSLGKFRVCGVERNFDDGDDFGNFWSSINRIRNKLGWTFTRRNGLKTVVLQCSYDDGDRVKTVAPEIDIEKVYGDKDQLRRYCLENALMRSTQTTWKEMPKESQMTWWNAVLEAVELAQCQAGQSNWHHFAVNVAISGTEYEVEDPIPTQRGLPSPPRQCGPRPSSRSQCSTRASSRSSSVPSEREGLPSVSETNAIRPAIAASKRSIATPQPGAGSPRRRKEAELIAAQQRCTGPMVMEAL